MLDSNANFDTYNTNTAKNPVVIITIDGMTNTYATGAWNATPVSTYKYIISEIDILGGNVDLMQFKTSPFGIDFTIVDQDLDFFSDATTNDIMGKEVTIRIGYAELLYSEFLILPICYVTFWNPSNDGITITIEARDKRHQEYKKNLFESLQQTYTTTALAAGATTVNVNSVSNFYPANTAPWGSATKTYLRIDEEIVEYTAFASGSFTIVRGQAGTADVAHDSGAVVSECYRIYDNPYELLIQLLTHYNNAQNAHSAGTATTFSVLLPPRWGLNLDKDEDVDIEQIINEYMVRLWDPVTTTLDIEYYVWEPQDPEKFIEEQVLRYIPAFIYYTPQRKIGLKTWDFRVNDEGLPYETINRLVNPKLKINQSTMVSEISMGSQYSNKKGSWEYIPIKYDNTETRDLATVKVRVKASDAIIASFIENELYHRYLRTKDNNHVYLISQAFLKYWLLQVGDIVNLSDVYLLNFRTGSRGWTDEVGILINTSIFVSRQRTLFKFKALLYNHFTTLDTTIELANEADIDDTTMVWDTTDTDATDANDAYYDFTETANNGQVQIKVLIQADLPVAGSDAPEYIHISMRAGEEAGGTFTANRYYEKKRIYYNASWTGTLFQELVMTIPNSSYLFQRVKCDYIFKTAVAANALSNVKMIQVKYLKGNYTLATK